MNQVATGYPSTISSETGRLEYCLYARKSTESDELQALSIDSQIKEMKEVGMGKGLDIVEVRQESHSAKDSGQRPVFNKMIEDIRKGMFNAILCWAPDRLSRNTGDLGAIVDLMDQGLLREIRTNGQIFTNSPNEKFLLMILCSQAKLENDNKGENVKRGLRAKCEMGYRPGVTPIGYLNEPTGIKGQRRIFIDPDRAPVIKKMFEKVAYEMKSGRDLYRWLNYEINFKNRVGKGLALSTIFRVLTNTYYYGEFEYPVGSGKWYKSNCDPIISKELFEKARTNLSTAPKKYGTKDFQFTKLITCGSCGCGVIAEEKFKRYKNGTVTKYVYYHCMKVMGKGCKELYIREDELLEQLIGLMDKIDFNRKGTFEKLKQEVERFNKFSEIMSGGDTKKISSKRADIKSYAKYVLREGKPEEKRELLSNLQTKLILKDKTISTEDDHEKGKE